MHYGKINTTDIANGPGVRVSLFVSGCRNHCKGCFNKETWDFDYGYQWYSIPLLYILTELNHKYISGLSILGGDPLEPENYDEVLFLCKKAKEQFPEKTIWVYTGYLFEDHKNDELMQYIDVLVDGRYIEEQRDITLKFRGSKNQRLIDVKASLDKNEIVLIED